MSLKKPLQIIILLTINFHLAYAQNDLLETKYIQATSHLIEDGLPSDIIFDIVQDENGLLWLATQDGLSRFDSTEFINFSKDKSDPFSLSDTLVEDMILMPNNELWLSIYEVGIAVFDRKTFQSKSIKNTNTSLYQLPNSNLFGIDKDQNNNVWFSLYGEGIYQWNTEEKKFTKYLSTDENSWLTSKQTFEIMVDKKNRLWVCSIDSKVYWFDINTGKSKEYNFSVDPNDLGASPIYGFTESKDGEIFAGGYSGVFKFNEESQEFDHIITESMIADFYGGERTTARRIMMDSNDNLWIGTVSSLLQYSNNALKRILFYEDEEILSDKWTAKSIIEGSDGNIWIATTGNGLIKVSSDWERYNVMLSLLDKEEYYHRAYNNDDYIWLVKKSSQLEQYEYINGQLELKNSILSPLGKEKPSIDIVYQDEPENIWISSSLGINKININTGEIKTVLNNKNQKLGAVKLFHRDIDKRFYFYLFIENQMGYFDESDMSAHMVQNTDDNFFNGKIVNQMSVGIDGKLWLATNGGIVSFDMQSHKYEQVFKAETNEIISSFYVEENQNDVWIIADGALYLLNWNGEKLILKESTFSEILPKIIFDKIKDVQNNIVTITTEDKGILEIDTKEFKHSIYSKENGLPSNRVIDVLFPDNTPLIVTEDGLVIQNNNFNQIQKNKPNIIIDTIKISDQNILIDTSKNLILEHDYGSIDFDMSMISYINSPIIEYEYMLEGFNNNWINRGSQDKFSFLNLDSGTYTFKVRGRRNYNEWSDIKEFSFAVKAPPWQSIWAYGLYTLSLLGVIYWLLYLYRRKILYEHEISEQQSKKRIAREASKAKSDFLARVSHEIRTPLNGVLGMSELMLDTGMNEEQTIYANSISASGQHLLDIINDILDLSKIEAGKLELEPKSFNLLILADEIVSVFTSQCKQKKIIFTCVFENEINPNRIGDAIRLKQILFNLLSNAFKFTKQGEITLIISSSSCNASFIKFKVLDTGLGIDSDFVEELFQPFVQADSAITRKYGGTGLGLAIVKQLVEKMHGTITARKREQLGSIFEANLNLEVDKAATQKLPKNNKNNVCLLIEASYLKDSLKNYLNLLNINHTDQINSETTSVFVGTFKNINKEYSLQLEKLAGTKTMVNFIGFNSEHIDPKLLNQLRLSRLLSLPITFSKIKNIYQESEAIEFENLETQSTPTIKPLNLLVVEDNKVNQQVSIEMLERMGHIVDIVDNAEEALTWLNRNQYDILLLDYHLPMMDGLSLVKAWENKNNIPIIIVTADLTDEVMQKCLKLNIDNIVAKPYTQLHLAAAIEKALA